MITVVVPLYNKAAHIERALRSIQRQTYEPAEVIVVDDGSTDGGGDIVRLFEMKGLRLISQKNLGVSAARNRGMSEAGTDLIAFLDADDEWLPSHLDTLVRLFRAFPDKGLYSTMHFIRDGIEFFEPASPFSENDGFCLVEDFFGSFAAGLSLVNSTTAAVPRMMALAEGGFPAGVRRGEDIILWTRLFLTAGMAHAPFRTAIYHRDAINRSIHLREQEPPGSLVYLAKMLSEHGLPHAHIDSARLLFEKISFFTAAGMKVSGDVAGLRAIRRLAQTAGSIRLRLGLAILEFTPATVLQRARKFRHKSAPTKLTGVGACAE
ncbi:glycosyltransferase involved in cell wall biosynthesis [Desulfomicrobium macestii]|uniref:Glycosyltransferase involved in cell wall biosynthesis n=1 Tax=Desulfomicrobium macestii TaxID=90731 RepID=A0ABR9H6Q1_9BACT|nr:glycosyltransferase family 2 protein [Desulfomicrobium macestii]MBE1426376.1 glycosyltransferase involved in cell wall biosynthesis [Desulfomicrobium macestii]